MSRTTGILFALLLLGAVSAAEDAKPKPIKAMLITGGCCHDYARQSEILKGGIESRINVKVTVVHSRDTSTRARFDMYDNPDWAAGYDVVIHDECSADITEEAYVQNILKAHENGVAAVNLHCAMHCYRTGKDDWFRFVGLQSTGHGQQLPIQISYLDRSHPVTNGLENWVTINEELYNNIKLFPTTVPLARGRQEVNGRVDDVVIAWANEFGRSRVFSTTLGHNNQTVGDARYLDLVTRGLLWSVNKLTPEYQQAFAKPRTEMVPVNLARGKHATATGSQSGHPPEHAIDGNEETRWCSPDAAAGQSWQVDLEQPQELTGCRILWEMDDTNYQYKVEGSSDGKSWQMLSDQTKTDLHEQSQTLKFVASGIRYVRLTTTGLIPGRWGSFFEFEVHGTLVEERVVTSSDSFKPRSFGSTGLLAGVKAPTGFDISVFAAPPDISYPACLASDLDGTVYVGIDENGSLDKRPGRGRIVRCRDRNDDGKAEEFIEFAKVDSPRGLVVVPQAQPGATSVFVLHPPDLSVYHDDNGDGVADRHETLVKNLGFDLNFRGADHTTNGIQMGIDGWIYVAVGDYGFIKAIGTDGRALTLKGGGIVRVRPDGAELEIVSRGQRNIYDVAISPQMDLFTRDNTNDGGGWNVRLSHVPQGAQMGYPSLFVNFRDEIVEPLADYGGGSPCGSLFMDEPAIPEELNQSLYTCDWGRSIVYRHPLDTKGAGFTAEQHAFIEVPRPTDMDLDVHGNLYISSWKDGGFNFSNPNVGFVIKVKVPSPTQVPTGIKSQDLLERLVSDSHRVRLDAQQRILSGQQTSLAPGLLAIARSDRPLAVRIAAIFTLKQLRGEQSHEDLLSLVNSADLREFALKAVADRKSHLTNTPTAPFVVALKDPDPRVRLQAVQGLGRFSQILSLNHASQGEIVTAMLRLVSDQDPIVRHVAGSSLVRLNAVEAYCNVLKSDQRALWPNVFSVLKHIHEPAAVAGVAEWLKRQPGPSESAGQASADESLRLSALIALCRLYSRESEYTGDWWGTRPDTTGPYYKRETWSESSRIADILQKEFKTASTGLMKSLLPQLQKHQIVLSGAADRVVALAKHDPTFLATAVSLVASGSDPLPPEAAKLLEAAAGDTSQPVLRTVALRGLQRRLEQLDLFPGILAAFASVTESQQTNDVGSAWNEFVHEPKLASLTGRLAELTGSKDPAARELAYAALVFVSEFRQAPKEARDQALRLVERAWSSPELSVSLLRAIGRSQQEAQILQIQQQMKSDRPEVKAAAQFAANRLELDKEPSLDPNKPLLGALPFDDVVVQTVSQKGDPAYGQRLFSRQGCVACHTVSQTEPLKGPLLADITKRYKPPELIESIVKPSAKIAQGFESQYFVTADGRIVEGFVVRESGEEIEIRTAAGISTVIKKDEIEERGKREASVMPVGLVDKLNAEQLASILAYLDSLKK